MKAQYEKLPIHLEKFYIAFIVMILAALLVLVYLQIMTIPYALVWGLIYVLGHAFFINKAIYGKREWIYYEIVTNLRAVVLITLYFKILY